MQAEIEMPWIAVVTYQDQARLAGNKQYHGDGRDILLQGFHWNSHAGVSERGRQARKSWYTIMKENAATIKAAGFSASSGLTTLTGALPPENGSMR